MHSLALTAAVPARLFLLPPSSKPLLLVAVVVLLVVVRLVRARRR
ncbi:hypothetical protein [Xylanimonas protaetiae]|nr:hypothetical protein [Xylanimonas protaetiae]